MTGEWGVEEAKAATAAVLQRTDDKVESRNRMKEQMASGRDGLVKLTKVRGSPVSWLIDPGSCCLTDGFSNQRTPSQT